jgi:hypothetical protein
MSLIPLKILLFQFLLPPSVYVYRLLVFQILRRGYCEAEVLKRLSLEQREFLLEEEQRGAVEIIVSFNGKNAQRHEMWFEDTRSSSNRRVPKVAMDFLNGSLPHIIGAGK